MQLIQWRIVSSRREDPKTKKKKCIDFLKGLTISRGNKREQNNNNNKMTGCHMIIVIEVNIVKYIIDYASEKMIGINSGN